LGAGEILGVGVKLHEETSKGLGRPAPRRQDPAHNLRQGSGNPRAIEETQFCLGVEHTRHDTIQRNFLIERPEISFLNQESVFAAFSQKDGGPMLRAHMVEGVVKVRALGVFVVPKFFQGPGVLEMLLAPHQNRVGLAVPNTPNI